MLLENITDHLEFPVVHPLDDVPEEKLGTGHLAPMKMTKAVRWSLFALRAYLLLMMAMVLYHVLTLVGLA